jgi:hypothetical protein
MSLVFVTGLLADYTVASTLVVVAIVGSLLWRRSRTSP